MCAEGPGRDDGAPAGPEGRDVSAEWLGVLERDAQPKQKDEPRDTRSLYEKLQEQRRLKEEAEAQEQRTRTAAACVHTAEGCGLGSAVRTLDAGDLEFLSRVESERRLQEERIRSETEVQLEYFRSRQHRDARGRDGDEPAPRPGVLPKVLKPSGPSQKDLIRSAIKKRRDPRDSKGEEG